LEDVWDIHDLKLCDYNVNKILKKQVLTIKKIFDGIGSDLGEK